MTEEELQDIRERAEAACTQKTLDADKTFDFFYYDVPALIAEVERLRSKLEQIANLYGNPYNPHEGVIIAREAISIAKGAVK